MALFSPVLLLLLLRLELHSAAGPEPALPQTLSCPAPAGVPGNNGLPGRDGRDGREGAVGPKGQKGEPGPSVQGPPGKAGPQGPLGLAGPKGQKGDSGPKGPQGPQGTVGSKGLKGDPGPPGVADNSLIRSLQSELQAVKSRLGTMEKAAGFPIFRKVGLKYYVSNGMKAVFGEALKFCTSAGGTLALPRNEAENKALSKMHAALGSTYIILGTTDQEVEGRFVDMSKKPLTYTSWRANEPNNHQGKEDCAGIDSAAKWNDIPCDSSVHVVCEIVA